MRNPYVKGTSSFQNFNSNVNSQKHLSTECLLSKRKELKTKSDNFLNYSDHQRCSFDEEIVAIDAIIESRNESIEH